MRKNLSDHDIAMGLRARDPCALEAVLVYVLRNHSMNWLNAAFPTLDREDIIQVSILNVWKKGHTYDPKKAKFKSWFNQICRNVAVSMLRNQSGDLLGPYSPDDRFMPKRNSKPLDEVSLEFKRSEQEQSSSQQLEWLEAQMKTASSNDLEIMFGESENDDLLAAKLGTTPGSIKTQRTRFKKRLRESGGDNAQT